MPNHEHSLFDAISCFKEACAREGFSPAEVALFFTLAEIWNKAMRPEVFKAWNPQLSMAGINSDDTIRNVRNKLTKGNVIFFAKEGNRGQPHYSFNALFGMTPPPLLLKIGSKTRVNAELSESKSRVNLESPQGKVKEKEQEAAKAVSPPKSKAQKRPSVEELIERIPSDLSKGLIEAFSGWAEYKQSLPASKRVQSLQSWAVNFKRAGKYSEAVVIDSIEKAIASGWQGWEHTSTAQGSSTTKPIKNHSPKMSL